MSIAQWLRHPHFFKEVVGLNPQPNIYCNILIKMNNKTYLTDSPTIVLIYTEP